MRGGEVGRYRPTANCCVWGDGSQITQGVETNRNQVLRVTTPMEYLMALSAPLSRAGKTPASKSFEEPHRERIKVPSRTTQALFALLVN